ncbi:NAD(P)H-dependent oxidoreductase subunit E, partial [Spirochaetota bacterium]
ILHALQGKYGYLPEGALKIVSKNKNVFLSKLYRLITTYQAFRTDPVKKTIVTVCNGSGCHVKGGGSLLKTIENKLSNNNSDITLEKVRCLGMCDISPAVLIDGEPFSGDEVQAKLSKLLG